MHISAWNVPSSSIAPTSIDELLKRKSNLVQIIEGDISPDTTHLIHVCQVIEY